MPTEAPDSLKERCQWWLAYFLREVASPGPGAYEKWKSGKRGAPEANWPPSPPSLETIIATFGGRWEEIIESVKHQRKCHCGGIALIDDYLCRPCRSSRSR